MRTLVYIANARLPTEKAHGLQIVKMCEAFADAGVRVVLIVPQRKNPIHTDVFSYYGARNNFEIRSVPILDTVAWGERGFLLETFIFAYAIWRKDILKGIEDPVIFSRDILASWVLARKGYKVFFEMHDMPRRFWGFWRSALGIMRGIVSQNQWKAHKLAGIMEIKREKILIAPNGYDPKLFETLGSKADLRRKLGLAQDKKIILYTGHLYDWKGADIMLEAARRSEADNGLLFVFVGGTESDILRLQRDARGLKNVLIAGHRPYREIPHWLKAADVLVLPNSGKYAESRFSTSPIKLFEYMASGTPVVVSDLPSIREIVSENEAVFFPPDDPDALARAVRSVLSDQGTAGKRASAALNKSKNYSWSTRAGIILKFLRI